MALIPRSPAPSLLVAALAALNACAATEPAPPPALAAAPAHPMRTPAPVSAPAPAFPAEASAAGHDRGQVRVRLTLDDEGRVARVEILKAEPPRVFDRAVAESLSRWRFEPGPAGRTLETDVVFRR